MSNINYLPGAGNAPFGNLQANPEGSQYSVESGYGATDTILLEKAVAEAIFDSTPEQYRALRLVFEKSALEKNLDEFEYLEKTFGRTALEGNAISAAVPAVPGAQVTQAVTVTAASLNFITVDIIIVYPDGTKGVVQAIAGNVLTVASQTSAGLPAVAVGDIFSIQSSIYADGQTNFSNYERMQTITRYNYIQLFLRAARWGKIERQKHLNAGRTNYLQLDAEQRMEQLRLDLFISFFNGTRGEFQLSPASGSLPAKAMGGIFPSMQAAGSLFGNPTLAGLRSTFETLAFATNHLKEGATRFIYATDEMLYELSKIFKDPGLMYAPNDSIAKLNLKQYEIGSMKFVPVPCELFKDQACFPASWARKMLILDQETINPVKMKGIPMIEMGATLDKGPNGTREGFKDWYVQGNMSLQFNNPLGSFYIDVQ